jgi:hypothetical protein
MRKTPEIPHVLKVLRNFCGRTAEVKTAFLTAFSKGLAMELWKNETW